MKTEESDLLETLSKDEQQDQLAEEGEQPVEAPTLERCFEELVRNGKDAIAGQCLLGVSDLRRKQIALLLSILPSQCLVDRPPEIKEAERTELKQFIRKHQGEFRKLIDLQEAFYKEAVTTAVDRAIRQEDESHQHQLAFNERRTLVEGLLQKRSIMGFRRLEQTESISRTDCIGFWNTLSTNEDIRRYMQEPSLKEQASQTISLILKYFVKGEDPDGEEQLQKQLLNSIITSKSVKCLMVNEQIELSRQNKERVVYWIESIPVFRKYCDADDDALKVARTNFGWNLLELLSPDQVVIHPDDKYTLIQTLMEDPDADLKQFNLNRLHTDLLKEGLANSRTLPTYLKLLSPCPLQQRKLSDIAKMVAVLDLGKHCQNEVTGLLERYDYKGLYNHPSIQGRYAQVYKLVAGENSLNDYPHYHEARKHEDHDLAESERRLRSLLSPLLDGINQLPAVKQRIIDELLLCGNWGAIEGSRDVSVAVKQALIEAISQSQDYRLLRQYKHTPISLKANAMQQVEKVLVECGVANFGLVSQLTNKIIRDISTFHIKICQAIADQNKRIIERRLSDEGQCPNLVKYIRYFRRDWELDWHHLKEAVLAKRRHLPSVSFELAQELLATIEKQRTFDCVKTEKRLTECDRQELINFFAGEEACREFSKSCVTIKAVDRLYGLLTKIDQMFKAARPDPKPIEVRNVSILKKLVRDFLKVDDFVIEEVNYDSVSVAELRKDSTIWSLLDGLYQTAEFQDFRKEYPSLLALRSSETLYQTIFEEYVVSKGVRQADVKDLLKSVDSSEEAFQKKLQRLATDNDQLLKNAVQVEYECLSWEPYRERDILKKALKHCSQQIRQISYENFIDSLQGRAQLQRLGKEKTTLILDALKKADLGVLQYEDDLLSRRDKQNICLEIHSNEAYQAYFTSKEDELSKKFKDAVVSLLPRDRNLLGGSRLELFDMEFINSKAGERASILSEKYRLFSGLRITKEQIKRNFREDFVKAYLIRAERARRESVKSLMEQQSTILSSVINGSNRSLPDILHLLFTEGRCDVPELPGLTHMTSKKFEQEYRGRPRFTDMKLILEELAYIDGLDAFQPSLCLLDAVRDHTSELINELSSRALKEVKPLEFVPPPPSVCDSRRFMQSSRLELSVSNVLSDLGNSDLSRPIKRLSRFVPQSN